MIFFLSKATQREYGCVYQTTLKKIIPSFGLLRISNKVAEIKNGILSFINSELQITIVEDILDD